MYNFINQMTKETNDINIQKATEKEAGGNPIQQTRFICNTNTKTLKGSAVNNQMNKEIKMNIEQACELLISRAEELNTSVLELCQDIDQDPERFSPLTVLAYRIFRIDAEKMFAPAK